MNLYHPQSKHILGLTVPIGLSMRNQLTNQNKKELKQNKTVYRSGDYHQHVKSVQSSHSKHRLGAHGNVSSLKHNRRLNTVAVHESLGMEIDIAAWKEEDQDSNGLTSNSHSIFRNAQTSAALATKTMMFGKNNRDGQRRLGQQTNLNKHINIDTNDSYRNGWNYTQPVQPTKAYRQYAQQTVVNGQQKGLVSKFQHEKMLSQNKQSNMAIMKYLQVLQTDEDEQFVGHGTANKFGGSLNRQVHSHVRDSEGNDTVNILPIHHRYDNPPLAHHNKVKSQYRPKTTDHGHIDSIKRERFKTSSTVQTGTSAGEKSRARRLVTEDSTDKLNNNHPTFVTISSYPSLQTTPCMSPRTGRIKQNSQTEELKGKQFTSQSASYKGFPTKVMTEANENPSHEFSPVTLPLFYFAARSGLKVVDRERGKNKLRKR